MQMRLFVLGLGFASGRWQFNGLRCVEIALLCLQAFANGMERYPLADIPHLEFWIPEEVLLRLLGGLDIGGGAPDGPRASPQPPVFRCRSRCCCIAAPFLKWLPQHCKPTSIVQTITGSGE